MRQAVILVGGKGTRLGGLARTTPKPLLPIAGDRRFLDYLIENVARHGVREILLVAGHLGEQVEDRYHGKRFGACEVVVVREPEPAGTGGALIHVRDQLDPVFLMLNGDSFFDFNYLALANSLQANDLGVLSLRWVDDGRRYGAVEHRDGRILTFREKDEALVSGAWISGGAYVLRKSILDHLGSLPCSIESEVFPQAATAGRLGCAMFEGYFLDIGLPETLMQGRAELPRVACRPAVLLDRDNTLNIDAGYTHRIEDLRWTDGAVEAIRAINDAGWLALVVTNQSGVGRGLYTEEQMHLFHEHMQGELAKAGAHIDAFYHCPFHPDATLDAYRDVDHPWRKPNPGMLQAALAEWSVDVARSVMIGDQESDMVAAQAAGVRGMKYAGGALDQLVRSAITSA
ncbi:histidinol phosphate phosphatase [Caulobacter sp. Root656]|nr:histidinol phosphate phosphatase [Caulobacter sp. Root656]